MSQRKPKVLDRGSLPHFVGCFEKIQPDDKPRFGSLTPAGLFTHLRILVEISLGERELDVDISNFITRSGLFFFLMIEVLPWPKGKIKAPDALTPPAGDFGEEKRLFFESMERFVAALEKDPNRYTRSPLLGMTPLRKWARVHGKHLCHHLDQFDQT